MADPMFTTIEQHWNHFLERDMPADAPPVQVKMMKQAFAAGAISGLQLAVVVGKGPNPVGAERTAAQAVESYRNWIIEKISLGERAIGYLRGKNLACWCKPGAPCHADVLLTLAND